MGKEDETDFGPYDFTVAGFSAGGDETQGGRDDPQGGGDDPQGGGDDPQGGGDDTQSTGGKTTEDAGPKPCPSEKPYLATVSTGDWCCESKKKEECIRCPQGDGGCTGKAEGTVDAGPKPCPNDYSYVWVNSGSTYCCINNLSTMCNY